ncbi:hypothetical protein, variant [Verruconis gallopava]|uniref:FFD box profile domain-containing protein n=1 Tax=Verruconis gallopava TaxID=253628 RepID=A0A0D1X962_9PEZI|nr:uncharacterized protein PV09_09588 [Verruconis gallopava]XP_016208515.1 hypothetical protein, variant [Verruconis gallopava]KIV98644.1 hypothetical protein PV09_09588 [Verruconis gallopava]KIV98645.1 hypothetical protein, variant [Verruconis gallopava]
MAEYIGARISLISKADIRYVGTLHEISSENSTVALENVRSMGTEDRRTGPGSVAASDRLYEYIIFRGSDVKDLRIEEPPKPAAPKQEAEVPDDPAILGSQRPPHQAGTPSQQPPFGQPPPYGQGFPGYPPPMHNQGFGRSGFPPGPGAPGFGYPGPGPYGGAPPPGWYPPGQGFPQGGPNPFPPQVAPSHPGQQTPRQQPTPIGTSKDNKAPEKRVEAPTKAEPSKAPTATSATATAQKDAPAPEAETVVEAPSSAAPTVNTTQAPPTGPKGRAPIPINPAAKTSPQSGSNTQPQNAQSFASATQAATAAVAAAMAKLPMAQKMGQQESGSQGVDNLAKKVQEMRTDDHIRHGRQQGTGGHVAAPRGRGRGRGGHHQHSRPIEVPTTDFDFESANAKFNKEDLAKEAIATGSPLGMSSESAGGAANGAATANGEKDAGKKVEEVIIPKAEAIYDKKTSFFDNISSELKDREEKRGAEFRNEERKKNMETFGQGSVDNYRRGYGRGRGRGFRGGGNSRGGYGPRGGNTRGNFNNSNNRPKGGAANAES